jgi:hypothetical protein
MYTYPKTAKQLLLCLQSNVAFDEVIRIRGSFEARSKQYNRKVLKGGGEGRQTFSSVIVEKHHDGQAKNSAEKASDSTGEGEFIDE